MYHIVLYKLQWNLGLTKFQGSGEICSLYRGLAVISKTGFNVFFEKKKQNVRYIEV